MSSPKSEQPPRQVARAGAELTRLSYTTEALDWERQALPIGNGRLGAMVLGEAGSATFAFNVDSLWTGGPNPSGEYTHDGFGDYQAFGELIVELDGVGLISDFSRELELGTALHQVRFTTSDRTRHLQQAFASHPAEVIAIRLGAEGAGRLGGRLSLLGKHAETTRASNHERHELGPNQSAASLEFSGTLANGLDYEARALVLAEDGALGARGAQLAFAGCQSVTIYLAAATNYALDEARGFRAITPEPPVSDSLERALALGFEALLEEHVRDHQALFTRVEVDFGRSAAQISAQPLDARIQRYQPGSDPELAAKLFQYGRYLLIAASRDNGLPANLQGLWNEDNTPPWHSDYHSNINTQMNYWLAEPANLPECHEPLFDLLDATLPLSRAATKAAFGEDVPGFTYRTSHNIFGGQGWEWNTTANAWYAMHYYEHFAFGGDHVFLETRAWPYLREASEFWLHRLQERADGRLVAPDGWSPEHGPREAGVSYDQQLIGELFNNTLEAASVLRLFDDPIVEQVAAALPRLLGPQIGQWGQLQEWSVDRDDPKDQHRHTSHLIGVYPGRQISVSKTPAWARAAKISLESRGDTGDSRRSWTWPWRCALWSRLGTSDCHRMIDGLIQHNLLPNMLATHPPLQLDGNYGMTAGICEMLLQSHAGELHLLPGVDLSRWPDGFFRGLRARGGFEVSASWSEGRLRNAELVSHLGGTVALRSTPRPRAVQEAQQRVVLGADAAGSAVHFDTAPGERYLVSYD